MNRLESEYIQHWLELGETFGDMLRVRSHLADYIIDVWDMVSGSYEGGVEHIYGGVSFVSGTAV